jgi:hypothetical protein
MAGANNNNYHYLRRRTRHFLSRLMIVLDFRRVSLHHHECELLRIMPELI